MKAIRGRAMESSQGVVSDGMDLVILWYVDARSR